MTNVSTEIIAENKKIKSILPISHWKMEKIDINYKNSFSLR